MVSYDIIHQCNETYDIECVKNSEPILVYHERPKYYKCKLYSLYICILILVISLIFMITNLVKDNNYYGYTAGAWPHSCGICHNKKLVCSDLRYGCCNISTYGNIENNKTSFIELHLNLHMIDKNDENGSNCPSYRKLITKYDKYYLKYGNYDYGMKYCNSTKEKCCKLDYIYDNLYRLQNNGNNYSIIKDYKDNHKHQYIELNIKGKCPHVDDIMTRYYRGYNDPDLELMKYIFILSIGMCCFGFSNINGNRRNIRNRRNR